MCLQAVHNEAPTSLHLSDYSLASQRPIYECAVPSRQPTQMLCMPTKGHPPTLCCLNDSPAHVMVEAAEQIARSITSGGWKVFKDLVALVPVKLFIMAVG